MRSTSSLRIVLFLVLLSVGLWGCSSSRPAAEEERSAGDYKQKKRDATSAAATVDPETNGNRTASHLSEVLKEQASGVQVQQSRNGIRVQIRGPSSIYALRAPLYLVDRLPVEPQPGGVLPSINPQNLKSVAILKGAEAAIYGSRGANGAVVVDTKDSN